jgi:single-stranded DNA-binding protein
MNNVNLIGHLTKDPELKATRSDAVCQSLVVPGRGAVEEQIPF